MSPLILAALVIVPISFTYYFSRRWGGAEIIKKGDTWDCGTLLTSRNEYTATGHSQPIARLFRSIYRSNTEIKVTPTTSPLIWKRASFRSEIEPIIERYLYNPVYGVVMYLSERVSVIQKGSIQAYLAYIFVLLLFLLVVFR